MRLSHADAMMRHTLGRTGGQQRGATTTDERAQQGLGHSSDFPISLTNVNHP